MNKPSRIDPFLGYEVVAAWLLWFCLDTLIAGIATFVMGIGLRWVSVWLEVEPPALVHSPRDLVKGLVISVALMVVFLKIRRWRRRRKHPLATRSFLLGQPRLGRSFGGACSSGVKCTSVAGFPPWHSSS